MAYGKVVFFGVRGGRSADLVGDCHAEWNLRDKAYLVGVDMNREIGKVTTAASDGLARFTKGERLIGQG